MPPNVPTVFLVPIDPEKQRIAKDQWTYLYRLRIIIVMHKVTTPSESLTDTTNGLIKYMQDIETLLENNSLGNILCYTECSKQTFESAPEEFVDNIYARAGELLFEGTIKPYSNART
ncbi:MAG: hypothetical protein ABEK36_03965 [Candidatus Aenigmatarchaeota archaeon]